MQPWPKVPMGAGRFTEKLGELGDLTMTVF